MSDGRSVSATVTVRYTGAEATPDAAVAVYLIVYTPGTVGSTRGTTAPSSRPATRTDVAVSVVAQICVETEFATLIGATKS